MARHFKRAMQQRVPLMFEIHYERWDAWYQNRVDPLPDGGLAHYFRDVTSQKKIEAKLVETVNQTEGIDAAVVLAFDAVHDGDFGKMVALRAGRIVRVPLAEATAELKLVDPEILDVARVFFG